ncbi:MAG: hypothetical protein R3C17_08915 [Planctomycetaceae bacterium]
MSAPSSDKHVPRARAQREQAGLIFRRLEELSLSVDDAATKAHSTNTKAPSALVVALMSDVSSLLEGIRDGWIEVSQPRIAHDLLQAVAELEKTDHTVLAAELSLLLAGLSSQGLAAENCPLRRERMRAIVPSESTSSR